VENSVTDNSLSIVELVMQSSAMAKGVLLILLIFSMVSWAIILSKFFVYKLAKKEDQRFLSNFSKSENLTHIYNFSRELRYSPIARVFLSGSESLFQSKTLRASAWFSISPSTGKSPAYRKDWIF